MSRLKPLSQFLSNGALSIAIFTSPILLLVLIERFGPNWLQPFGKWLATYFRLLSEQRWQ